MRTHSSSSLYFGLRPTVFVGLLAASSSLAGCGDSSPGQTGSGGATGVGTGGAQPSMGGSTAKGGTVGAGGTVGTVAGSSNATGGVVGNTGGISAGGASGAATSGGVPGAGAGGVPVPAGGSGGAGTAGAPGKTNKDHCIDGYDPLANDKTMKAGPNMVGNDTAVQPEVLEWMAANKWTGAHVVWHAVRGCSNGSASGLLGPLGLPNICQDYPHLVPTDQTCRSEGDGYQFLLFHRHMREALQQLWPEHKADFAGFPKFPTKKEELPGIWAMTDPTWTPEALEAAAMADNIEQHLDKFPSEGALGYWLQCPVGSQKPSYAPNIPYVGLHFNLHDEWSRGMNAMHGLNNGQVNITNYMFWKLHGWIDVIWDKYRAAKGLNKAGSPEQAKYVQDMRKACYEMDDEIKILQGGKTMPPMLDCPPDVDETGEFHTKVRPILENDSNHCSSCHGPAQTSPYAGLTLGGSISSKCVVERLKAKTSSIGGGQFKIIEPGDPDKSWLYLKASGKSETAGCVSTNPDKPCNTAAMPPGKRTMTDAELEILRKWIADGAKYP